MGKINASHKIMF